MGLRTLLVANRGEIAVRVVRAAAELGIRTVAVHAPDDAGALHTRLADESRPLRGTGVRAYLDADQMVEVASAAGADAIHPGYGFLSENPGFAARCGQAGLTFVGPRPEILELFGDKTRGRALAESCGVPVPAGTGGPASLADARRFLAGLPAGSAVMVKAVGGGGGRGVRMVRTADELAEAYELCAATARAAFGNTDLYVERYLPRARHVEVQIVGDGTGEVSHLWERDCSIQRRHQKLFEVAPGPGLAPKVRNRVLASAVRMAAEVKYDGLGTFEFLVDVSGEAAADFAFIEANPRLQVEHTVTEELLDVDLVQAQLRLAGGESLRAAGLAQEAVPEPAGYAAQVRINMETMTPDGTPLPAGGVLRTFEVPSGPGVRVDTYGYTGYEPSPHYDSLIAKLIVRSRSDRFSDVVAKARRALAELRIEGVETNAAFLRALLAHDDLAAGGLHTTFLGEHLAELSAYAGDGVEQEPASAVTAPMRGTVVSVAVEPGDRVAAGGQMVVLEAMKMEHVVPAPYGGVVQRVVAAPGRTVSQGDVLVLLDASDVRPEDAAERPEWDPHELAGDPGEIRPDLAEAIGRHELGLDDARPEAVRRRREAGRRTARENVADLCDPGTFVEYGPLVIAAQRRRRPVEELIEKTPADGLITGVGDVNGERFGPERSQCVVLAYDYTVLAGTQGHQNHRKKDRMFELAERHRLPVVLFAEGGGGRPGDVDAGGVAHLDVRAFEYFARLSGLVPLVGILSGRCFAGNAALLGCCDVVIATAGSTIGMGGPAMIEGAGLGVFGPEEVGPMNVQVPNGVVDIEVADEAAAVDVAKRYLGYFQGPVPDWECADQRRLRSLVPENRLRTYDVTEVIETLADSGSVLHIRGGFGRGLVTVLARIEGRPLGIVANNPTHLAGAVDADGADKAARFLQLCDAFGLPVLFLCDTPGIMVGPDAEKTALVRHVSRMFVVGASLTVPFFTIVLRKAYGLGAQTMAGGSFRAPHFVVSWPTGEFGGMGLEGAVRLAFRKELAAIKDPRERQATFERMVADSYERGKALNTATFFEFDDVIDPAESRRWIATAMRSPAKTPEPGSGSPSKRRPCIDTW